MSQTWLALQFPHLALDLLTRGNGRPRDLPLAVSDGDARRPIVLDVNPAASRLGIRAGLPVSAALSLAGALQVTARDAAAEIAALDRLAAWSYQYSSAVSVLASRHTLLLETGASERLLGDSESLAQQLSDDLLALGYHARAGTGPTPEAAQLAARRGLHFASRSALQEALRTLPLQALMLSDAQCASLESMGFRHAREVLRLPRKALARRLGTDAVAYLDRLCGRRPDPQTHWRLPETFRSGMDLPAEITNSRLGKLCWR